MTDAQHYFDLLPMVEADTQLKRTGSWWIGPCPFCGGQDRFNLHQTNDGWKWFCRRCGDGRYHDAAAYVMRRENLDYPAALKRMEGDLPTWSERDQRTAELMRANEERQPPPIWRQRGRVFVEECRQHLWKDEGAKALAYLYGRGLNERTLLQYQVGYNPSERFEKLGTWGLEGDGTVKLERGITLPCIGLGGLYSIKIRRPVAPGSKERKYVQVRGGKLGLFGWENMPGSWLAVVTEGEFDCMTLDQQAGDIAGVCTLGSATDSPMTINAELLRWMYTAKHTLVVFDNDEAGQQGALAFQERAPSVRILNLPDEHHDINDAALAGLDLNDWLCRECERLGIVAEAEHA